MNDCPNSSTAPELHFEDNAANRENRTATRNEEGIPIAAKLLLPCFNFGNVTYMKVMKWQKIFHVENPEDNDVTKLLQEFINICQNGKDSSFGVMKRLIKQGLVFFIKKFISGTDSLTRALSTDIAIPQNSVECEEVLTEDAVLINQEYNTSMEEYENKSFEELHFADHADNRKGGAAAEMICKVKEVKRKKKHVTWCDNDNLTQIFHFESCENEREYVVLSPHIRFFKTLENENMVKDEESAKEEENLKNEDVLCASEEVYISKFISLFNDRYKSNADCLKEMPIEISSSADDPSTSSAESEKDGSKIIQFYMKLDRVISEAKANFRYFKKILSSLNFLLKHLESKRGDTLLEHPDWNGYHRCVACLVRSTSCLHSICARHLLFLQKFTKRIKNILYDEEMCNIDHSRRLFLYGEIAPECCTYKEKTVPSYIEMSDVFSGLLQRYLDCINCIEAINKGEVEDVQDKIILLTEPFEDDSLQCLLFGFGSDPERIVCI